ncbi:MAG: (d)CMP kinase [Firmicutes bacterium]|nr:(d)CMP kinase [Bacillota bacterium]
MLARQLNIAIDGPAGAGKSSVARAVAEALGLVYLDTGAMYRAITWKAQQQNLSLQDPEILGRLAETTEFTWSDDELKRRLLMDGSPIPAAIRSPAVTRCVSLVASQETVRRALRQKQQQLARSARGIIMDGRDIGTAVMPEADLKIFLTASLEERARRRMHDLGQDVSQLPQLMREMAARDHQDSTREHSPLSIAPDATVIDTTGLSLSQVVELVIRHAEQICLSRGE